MSLLAAHKSPILPLDGGSPFREQQQVMILAPPKANKRKRGPLLGSFEQNVLNNRLKPIRTVEGYRVEIRASSGCRRQVKPLKANVRVKFFAAGGNSFPYLGQVNIGHPGYRIPKRGTLQVSLFNPLGTIVNLFLLYYDLADMPANSQTFMRQKTVFAPRECRSSDYLASSLPNKERDCDITTKVQPSTAAVDTKQPQPPSTTTRPLPVQLGQVRYLIQFNIVSSKSGRIYINKDLRIFISKKVDLDTAAEHAELGYQLKSIDEMPSNPRYFSR